MIDACLFAFIVFVADHRVDARDLNFMFAQEAFVSAARPGFRPPAKVDRLLELAGDREYCARASASHNLRKVDVRWLYYGLHSSDLEVKLRCNNVLKAHTVCNSCNRTGLCLGKFVENHWDATCDLCKQPFSYHYGGEPRALCTVCNGRVVVWNRSAFDFVEKE